MGFQYRNYHLPTEALKPSIRHNRSTSNLTQTYFIAMPGSISNPIPLDVNLNVTHVFLGHNGKTRTYTHQPPP